MFAVNLAVGCMWDGDHPMEQEIDLRRFKNVTVHSHMMQCQRWQFAENEQVAEHVIHE